MIKVIERLRRFPTIAQANGKRLFQCLWPNLLINPPANPHQHAGTQGIHTAQKQIKTDHKTNQRQKGRDTLTGQHTIIYLKHKKRARQHQQVRDTAQSCDNPEHTAQRCNRGSNWRLGRTMRSVLGGHFAKHVFYIPKMFYAGVGAAVTRHPASRLCARSAACGTGRFVKRSQLRRYRCNQHRSA